MSTEENTCDGQCSDKMNRCINCVHYRMLFIRHGGRYKGFQNEGFCIMKTSVISKDGFCEVWQKRKIDQDLYERKHISVLDNFGTFVLDFDE
ncbi:MAG: hypothetical protein K2M47_00200 [Clostridiales bacterium]|nr:hypothetical protein [Clostridiales bacterium]